MKFSIITITHNRAHLIGDTIQSVLNQSYADFEHIIIDDGSKDDTDKVVNSFNDPRISYHQYPKNEKRSFLRNEGIRKAQGEYVCILDSDDLWTPNKLETLLSVFLKHSDVDFIIHNIKFLPESAYAKTLYPFEKDFKGSLLKELIKETILPFPVLTIRKKALTKIGLIDETMIDGQHDLYFRASAVLTAYYCVDQLIRMRKHSQNISKNYDMTHYNDYLKSIDKLALNNQINKKTHACLKSKIYGKIAYIYEKQQQNKDAKNNYLKSFYTAPMSLIGLKSLFMLIKKNPVSSNSYD